MTSSTAVYENRRSTPFVVVHAWMVLILTLGSTGLLELQRYISSWLLKQPYSSSPSSKSADSSGDSKLNILVLALWSHLLSWSSRLSFLFFKPNRVFESQPRERWRRLNDSAYPATAKIEILKVITRLIWSTVCYTADYRYRTRQDCQWPKLLWEVQKKIWYSKKNCI